MLNSKLNLLLVSSVLALSLATLEARASMSRPLVENSDQVLVWNTEANEWQLQPQFDENRVQIVVPDELTPEADQAEADRALAEQTATGQTSDQSATEELYDVYYRRPVRPPVARPPIHRPPVAGHPPIHRPPIAGRPIGRPPVAVRPGPWKPYPGWRTGWRWHYNAWYPRWWHAGIVYPAWIWIAVPQAYYQCTSFNPNLRAFSAVGPTLDQAAWGALYACGGSNYQGAGCYVPQGYCRN